MNNPLDELYEHLKRQKKKGIAVVSNDYVMKKIREHREIEFKPPDRLVETLR